MIGSCRKLRGKFTFVVVDEAHHLAAEDDEEGYTNQYTRLLKRVEWDYLLVLRPPRSGLTSVPRFDTVAYRSLSLSWSSNTALRSLSGRDADEQGLPATGTQGGVHLKSLLSWTTLNATARS